MIWSFKRISTNLMWNESCTESMPPMSGQDQLDSSREFLLSLRPQPGCEKDGKCNECGLCEH